MARIYKCKKVAWGEGEKLISGFDGQIVPITIGHDLAGNEIEQHEWVAPPPPLKDKNPLPAGGRKYQEFIEKHGQEKLL